MASERPNGLADGSAGIPRELTIVKEGKVLRPRDAYDRPETMPCHLIEQVHWRKRIEPNRVDADPRHVGEVLSHSLCCWELPAVPVWRKGAVCDSLDEEALFATT